MLGTAIRFGAAIVVVGAFIQVILVLRPDLQHPADIGSDGSNYAAAGQRIAVGHQLYGLAAGDRPVPADNAPYWKVPLLSPPPLAALWRLLVVLPLGVVIDSWWLGGVLVASTFGAYVVARAPVVGLIATTILAPGLAVTAWSGNVNAFLIGLFALIWVASERRSPNGEVIAGVMAAVAAAVKVTPVLLIVWFVATRQWRAVVAMLAAGVTFLVVSIVIAGVGAHLDYLEIGRSTAAIGATPDSLSGLLIGIGADRNLAALAPFVAALITVAATLAAGRRSDLAFAATVVGLVLASPVTRYESLSMSLAALMPWIIRTRTIGAPGEGSPLSRRIPSSVASRFAALGVPAMTCALGVILATPSRFSSLTVENTSPSIAVVRVYPTLSTASFGYSVPPESSGSAWVADVGAITGRVVLLDATCAVIAERALSPTGGSLAIGPTRDATLSAPADAPSTRPFLAYTSDCAIQGTNR